MFFHLLAAFLLVSGLVAYSGVVLSSRGEAVSRALGSPALALWNAGGLGTLAFGVWLALESTATSLGRWIIAALVLWLIGSGAARAARRRGARGTVGRAGSKARA